MAKGWDHHIPSDILEMICIKFAGLQGHNKLVHRLAAKQLIADTLLTLVPHIMLKRRDNFEP